MARDWDRRGDELAAAAIAKGRPTEWFDRLYAEGVDGTTEMPWNRVGPHPRLEEWVDSRSLRGEGRRGVVVGAGLGADAEFLARRGFATAAFDVSPTAVAIARDRHPATTVDYRVADLLALPEEWRRRFDLVVEIFTLQALPDPPRQAAARSVVSLVGDGGTLLVVAFRYDGSSAADHGPPFPLKRADLLGLAEGGLEPVTLEELPGPLWRAEYRRPTAAPAN